MPKKKIKRSVARRFEVTKTGKVKFRHQNHGHLMTHKSGSRIRRQNIPGILEKSFAKKVKKMLGFA